MKPYFTVKIKKLKTGNNAKMTTVSVYGPDGKEIPGIMEVAFDFKPEDLLTTATIKVLADIETETENE